MVVLVLCRPQVSTNDINLIIHLTSLEFLSVGNNSCEHKEKRGYLQWGPDQAEAEECYSGCESNFRLSGKFLPNLFLSYSSLIMLRFQLSIWNWTNYFMRMIDFCLLSSALNYSHSWRIWCTRLEKDSNHSFPKPISWKGMLLNLFHIGWISSISLTLDYLSCGCRLKSSTCMIMLVSTPVLAWTQNLWLTFLVWLATKLLLLVLMLHMILLLGISTSTMLVWVSPMLISLLLWPCKWFLVASPVLHL